MRTGISVTLAAEDRRRLEAIVRDRNAPQKHVWRAEIVLLSAAGLGTVEIMRRTGKSKTLDATREPAAVTGWSPSPPLARNAVARSSGETSGQ
jgi:hypothetical protein